MSTVEGTSKTSNAQCSGEGTKRQRTAAEILDANRKAVEMRVENGGKDADAGRHAAHALGQAEPDHLLRSIRGETCFAFFDFVTG